MVYIMIPSAKRKGDGKLGGRIANAMNRQAGLTKYWQEIERELQRETELKALYPKSKPKPQLILLDADLIRKVREETQPCETPSQVLRRLLAGRNHKGFRRD